jgi:hypothetical protein
VGPACAGVGAIWEWHPRAIENSKRIGRQKAARRLTEIMSN